MKPDFSDRAESLRCLTVGGETDPDSGRTSNPRPTAVEGIRQSVAQTVDLTALPRAAAATVEMLAEAAAIHFASRIGIAETLIEKAPNPSRYRDTIAGEIAMYRSHLATARRFETAARRRRVARLSEEDHVILDVARELDPGSSGSEMEALLRSVPADPLAVAGMRLDAAAAEFRDYCASAAMSESAETPFARLEAALETARDTYRRLLTARSGQTASLLERRLAS